ncbi:hypothetical protein CMUS01_06729 [Colletotrichum musicola]|uniref:BZIP domain-containing protein n=1 Tax=Colletotrichum musicola TaxID=2175873 RepID=A0A8H6KKJ1_9PEZI|nr:hypothetical protein CMUS01_06729 [Colletotrichum musicola]
MSSSIFRIFNPGGPKEDTADKRRAQLRRAQRSYRDRKENYTRCLEKEVAQIKVREANLTRQCESLLVAVQALQQILVQHQISVPLEQKKAISGLCTNSPTSASVGSLSVSPPTGNQGTSGLSDNDSTRGISTETGKSRRGSPHSTTSSEGYSKMGEHTKSPKQRALASPSGWPRATHDPAVPAHRSVRLCDLDPVKVGMEFVLTVERPCLGHIEGDRTKPHEPTGHALTVSAQLLFAAPNSFSDSHGISPASYEGTPSAVLDRLLDLSPDLCSEGELTPAQAWHYIRSQPNFGGIKIESFQILAARLREAVNCHG